MSPLDWLVRTSLHAAVLVLLILVAQRLLGRRLPPRWRHALWWIVVARLLLPPLVLPGVASLGAPDLPRVFAKTATLETPDESSPPTVFDSHPLSATAEDVAVHSPALELPVRHDAPATAIAPVSSGTPPAPGPDGGPSLALVLTWIWLGGAAGLALWTIAREVWLARRMRRDPPLADPAVRDLVLKCCRETGFRRRIGVAVSHSTTVPALTGLFRPRLLLPAGTLNTLSPEQLRHVVLHELEHVRHHDIAWNWLLHLVLCVHWMNPLVWLAMARLRIDRECVRDLGVLGRSSGVSGRDYGRTILRIVQSSSLALPRPAVVSILETRSDVKRRIAMIARHDGTSGRGLLTGGFVALVLALLAVVSASAPAAPDADRPATKKPTTRPGVLVTTYQVSGDILEKESRLETSLEALTEALLARTFQTASYALVEEACREIDCSVEELKTDADVRLAVSKRLGVTRCITGWVVSFGRRIILILEVITPANGLPGEVHRATCDGVEGLPAALEGMLDKLGLLKEQPVVARAAVIDEPDRLIEEPMDLDDIFAKIPEDDLLETYPNEAYRRLVALRDQRPGRFTAGRRAEAERLLGEVIRHCRRLNADRAYRDEFAVRENVRLDPVLSKFPYDVVARAPYLLFVEKTGPSSRLAATTAWADTLVSLEQQIHRLFGEVLGLPKLADRSRAHERILKVFVFNNDASFRRYQQAIGQPLPPSVRSYYSHGTRWVMLALPQTASSSPAGMEVVRRDLVHEATHQLMHAYAKILLERETGHEVDWSDKRLHGQSMWMQEGFSELIAGAMDAKGKDWSLTSLRRTRVRELKITSDRDMKDWPLANLLQVSDYPALRRRAVQMLSRPPHPGRLCSLFFAQSWAFCHFLYNHEDGKYRAQFHTFLKGQLTGKSDYRSWQRIWGKAADDHDWSALEAEWRAYVAGLTK